MKSQKEMNYDFLQVALDSGNLRELLIEEAKLKAELKSITKIIDDLKREFANKMLDMDLEELPLDTNTRVIAVKGYSYKSLKSDSKKELLKTNPEMFGDVNVRPYVKVMINE